MRDWLVPVRLGLCAVLLVAAALSCAGRCIHDEVVQHRVAAVTNVDYSGDRAVGRSGQSSWRRPQPIRITAHYSTLENMVLRPEERSRLNSSVQEAIGLLAKLLAVVPVVDKLLLSRDMGLYCKSVWRNSSLPNFNKCGQKNNNYRTENCLDIVIPDDHLRGYSVWPADGQSPTVVQEDGAGVRAADFILYIKAAETSKCRKEPSVIAYASSCQVDQTGRPIAGAVTFCHSRLRGSAFHHLTTTLTTVHELLHALGFSKDLYDTWLDCSSAPSIGVNCSSRPSATNTDEENLVRIYTRAVIQQMQQHFNSSSPELGGPLENKGRVGVPSSHWESRFLQGSIMAATMGSPSQTFIDPITLAVMSDTGWYLVNYNSTQNLVWGRGQGERFGLRSTCNENSSQYFCTGSGLGCHYLHMDKGSCTTDEFLEGCRVYKPLVNRSECWKEENAMGSGNLSKTGEIYGERSRCFFGNLTKADPSSAEGGRPASGHCYLHRCLGENAFEVKVRGSPWLQCRAGDSIQVPSYRGLLLCPDGRLCRNFERQTPDWPQTTVTAPQTLPGPSTPAPTAPGGPSEGAGPGARLRVRMEFRRSEECAEMEDRDARPALQSLSNVTAIPRCHIQNPVICARLELCFELWEYSRCSNRSAVSLYRLLEQRVSSGNLRLQVLRQNCTVEAIRSGSGPSPSPPAEGGHRTVVLTAVICGCLGGAVALSALGLAIYRKVYRGRGRVHAESWSPRGTPLPTGSGRSKDQCSGEEGGGGGPGPTEGGGGRGREARAPSTHRPTPPTGRGIYPPPPTFSTNVLGKDGHFGGKKDTILLNVQTTNQKWTNCRQ